MKKVFLVILALCVMMTSLCLAEEEAPACEFDLDVYGMTGGTMKLLYADGSVEETGGWGVVCDYEEGMTIGAAMARLNVTGVEVVGEEDIFQGWLVYDVIATTDEDGWDTYEYVLVSQEPLTTEALLQQPLPQTRRMYAAKWAGIPVEDYFSGEAEEAFTVSMPAVTLLANQGAILVHSEEEDYEIGMNVATAEPGQLLGEVLEMERVLSVTREGYTFAGWAVYEVREMESLEVMPEEEGVLWFQLYEDWFLLFRDYTLLAERATTEEVSAMSFGEADVYIVAMWE